MSFGLDDVHLLEGDPLELKWNRKDLETLIQVLPLVKDKRVVVQAGGCLGVFPKYLAQFFKAVYTFEPSFDLFKLLVKNVPEPNVVKLQAALGDKRRMVQPVSELRGDDGKSVLHAGMTWLKSNQGIVPTLRVDDLSLDFCDLLYLDVEGWELFALRGAVETVWRCRPIIVCEVNRGIEYQGLTQDGLREFLQSTCGYCLQTRIRSDEIFVPC